MAYHHRMKIQKQQNHDENMKREKKLYIKGGEATVNDGKRVEYHHMTWHTISVNTFSHIAFGWVYGVLLWYQSFSPVKYAAAEILYSFTRTHTLNRTRTRARSQQNKRWTSIQTCRVPALNLNQHISQVVQTLLCVCTQRIQQSTSAELYTENPTNQWQLAFFRVLNFNFEQTLV